MPALTLQPATPFRVNTGAASWQFFTSTAADAAGNTVITWTTAFDYDGTGNNAYGRLFDSLGIPRGPQFRINSYAPGDQYSSGVAMTPDGRFVAVTNGPGPQGPGIYFRRYDADGTPLDAQEVRVNQSSGWVINATIAADSAGNFLIGWSNWLDGAYSQQAFARLYDADGVARTNEFLVEQPGLGNPWSYYSGAGFSAEGTFVATFGVCGTNLDADGWGSYAQRFAYDPTASGTAAVTAIGGSIRLNAQTAGSQGGYAAVALDGSFAAFLQSDATGDTDVYVRRFNADGTAIDAADTRINEATAENQYVAGAQYDAAGNLTVMWQTQHANATWDIYAKVLSPDLTPLTGDRQVTPVSEPYHPWAGGSFALGPDGSFIASWSNWGGDGDGWGVSARLFATDYSNIVPVVTAYVVDPTAAFWNQRVVDANFNLLATYTGATTGGYVFKRSGDMTVSLTVAYTVGGDAVAGRDYEPLSGTVTFAPGEYEKGVLVRALQNAPLLGDSRDVQLTSIAYNGSYFPVASTELRVTIRECDLGQNIYTTSNLIFPHDVSIYPVDTRAAELPGESSTGAVLLIRDLENFSYPITVNYTADGTTADPVADYVPPPGQASFGQGVPLVPVTILAVNDTITEGDETVVVRIGPGVDYTVMYQGPEGVWIGDDESYNYVPYAMPDTYDVSWNNEPELRNRLTVGGWGVLFLDNDPDHDWLTAVLANGPSHASFFMLFSSGRFVYVPEQGFIGDDTFSYQASDAMHVGPAAQVTIHVGNWSMSLVGDTNRDGAVTDADKLNRSRWTRNAGAIFAVNHNDSDGNHVPDAIDFADSGRPTGENRTIQTADRAAQLAPLRITRTGTLPSNAKVVLRVGNKSQAQAIHLFKARAVDEVAILGRIGDRAVGGTPAPTDVDITPTVEAQQTVEMGLEGLLYRFIAPSSLSFIQFDGYIDLYLEVTSNVGGIVLSSDHVRMKVAPWMLLSNQQASQEVWAVDASDFNASVRLNAAASPGYYGLDNSNQLHTYPNTFQQSLWAQDHAEIGYTQRPGGPRIHETLRMPYRGEPLQQPGWVKEYLLGYHSGVFQIGRDFLDPPTGTGGSGDYGGNLELMPPTPNAPLGTIVVGSTMSTPLRRFLWSQDVQGLITLPTKWLQVGHMDEVVSFDQVANRVIIADPVDAYAQMQAIPVADRGKSVFFAPGNTLAGTVLVHSATNPTIRVLTQIDLSGATGADWAYIRIYDSGSSGAKGQIGLISAWGNGWVEVSQVWDTTSNITTNQIVGDISPSFYRWTNDVAAPAAPFETHWFREPGIDDKFVLLQRSLTLRNGTPAAVTVQEVLADPSFSTVNIEGVKANIDEIKYILNTAAGGPSVLSFVSVPDLFFGRPADAQAFNGSRSAYAFAPGLANVQIIADQYYFPRPFAPQNAGGQDIFEAAVRSRLAGGPLSVLFVDDWSSYHNGFGEVHCGSLVMRAIWDIDWWTY
ncbi:MAG: protein-arginine deiminase family protein [Gemmataceae bacterium]